MSHLKRNLTIVFLCCVTLGICAVGFAQSGEEEDVQGDLDNYKLQIQEDIEAMMECGEDCAGLTIEPPSLEEVIGGKEVDPEEIDDIRQAFEANTDGSTRGGVCSSDSSYIYCQNTPSDFDQAVVGGKAYGSDYFIVCIYEAGSWSLAGWAQRTTQTVLYFYGAAQDENIGIIRNSLDLGGSCVFDDFSDWFTRELSVAGLSGEDTVNGSQYNDVLFGEYVLGHEDVDSISLNYVTGITPGAWGGYGDDTITGTANADYIEGNAGNDTVYGGNGNDVIYGGDGNDTLNGENNNDYLYGGNGTDTCNGGAGTDYCEASPSCDSSPGCP
jgi:Ca2+-binding RTX toxin-like protein